ncbi:MAG TPA: histidine phosphatase family protein [Spirochaetia bacterium]|nr:histidine phosphatase family protein [Spirochaetia bacterium]
MKLYLIRHGDPDYANDTLTDRGHREASALVEYLQREGIEQIVASPLGRARDTATYSAEAMNLDVSVEPWMTELHLPVEAREGTAAWDIPGHIIRNRDYLRDPSSFDRIPHLPLPQTDETLERIRTSSDRFLASLGYVRDDGAYRVAEPNSRRIAIFAHGGFGLTWLALLLEIPVPLMWSGFFLHTSSVTQILFDERGDDLATPRCVMMSALPHLYANSMEPGTAGIKANYA